MLLFLYSIIYFPQRVKVVTIKGDRVTRVGMRNTSPDPTFLSLGISVLKGVPYKESLQPVSQTHKLWFPELQCDHN